MIKKITIEELDKLLKHLPKDLVKIIYDYYFDTGIVCSYCNRMIINRIDCVTCQWAYSWYKDN